MTCVNFNANCMKCKSYSTDLKGLKQRKTEFTQFVMLSTYNKIDPWASFPTIFAIVTVELTLALILALDDAYGLVFYVDRVSTLGKLCFGKLTSLKCVIG